MGRKWSPDPALLQPGEASDREVGLAQGVDRSVVCRWRKAHGIAAGGTMGRPVGIRWEPRPGKLQPGEASDQAVAKDQSISVNTVRRWRKRNE